MHTNPEGITNEALNAFMEEAEANDSREPDYYDSYGRPVYNEVRESDAKTTYHVFGIRKAVELVEPNSNFL